ncbi:MAG: helicase-associated domain-containing protein [Anaerolineaceae bacterium]|nr:helicase-associated domain-containing protein [Anaerolineaceae bacterium]
MPDLAHTLQGHDLGFLKIVATAWGIELNAPDVHTALPLLTRQILVPGLVQEVATALPAEAQQALQHLLEGEGRSTWASFCRRFGEIRPMGAARRDRERPDLKPASPTEILWYRALIGRAILNLPPEPQEYAYIPDDVLELLPAFQPLPRRPLGRPASPAECAHVIPATDAILDDSCTLLASLRLGTEPGPGEVEGWQAPLPVVEQLLRSARLIDYHNRPQPEPVRRFLEASRGAALAQLVQVWMQSLSFNELRLLPGLLFEGEWQNQPADSRQKILELLSQLPQDIWWNLPSFVNGVREQNPDFQRPAGDYDSWFIRNENSQTYLRGFSAWDEVDGALIRFIITGPLHWLGLYDLAAPDPQSPPVAFRPSQWSPSLWHGNPPALAEENASLIISSDGRLEVPRLAPRTARYQIARFAQWEGRKGNGDVYRITPAALERAQKQGLRSSHLLAILRRYASQAVPPALLQALERWEKFGSQAHIESVMLLRVASPEIIETLRKTKAARFLGEALTPTVVIVRPGGETPLRNALAQAGYLAEAHFVSGSDV